jgi:hypothetical protein
MAKRIRVRATREGYYNYKRRKEGEVFYLIPIRGVIRDRSGREKKHTFTPEQQLSEKWMERVPEDYVPSNESEKPRAPVSLGEIAGQTPNMAKTPGAEAVPDEDIDDSPTGDQKVI